MSSWIQHSILLVFAFFALTACGGGGGGGGGGPAVGQGQFIDAAVEGISYTSGGESGLTDASGTFSYETGKSVTFSIGGIQLGTVSGKTIITPVNLVAGAVDETDPTVTNIVQFLLTIDEDMNATNGIQISDAMRMAASGLSVNFASASFDTDAAVTSVIDALAAVTSIGTRTLVNNSAARAHLSGSLFSLLAGNYSGTFTGDDSGTWSVTIATNGNIFGSGNSVADGPFTITGAVDSSGDVTASGFAGLATWTGAVDVSTGNMTGNWTVTSLAESGTFSGSKL